MSVWLTPDRKPFFGGTYFPPDNRYGRPGFARHSREPRAKPGERIASAWRNPARRCSSSSGEYTQQCRGPRASFRQRSARFGVSRPSGGRSIPSSAASARAPKFPRPSVFNFLLRYWRSHRRDEEALDMVLDHSSRDGQGRHARSARRRLSSLLGGRALVRAAFRKDAVRSGAARDFVSGGVPDHARRAISPASRATSSTTFCAT